MVQVTTTFNVVLHVPKLKEAEISTVLRSLRAFAPNEVGLVLLPCPPSGGFVITSSAQRVCPMHLFANEVLYAWCHGEHIALHV